MLLIHPRALVFVSCLLTSAMFSQGFFLAIPIRKELDSIYYKSKTTWILPSPFMFTVQKYSMDKGQTYLRSGIMANNLNKFIKDIPEARRSLNAYKVTRMLGLFQMVVLPFYFLKREIDWVNNYNRTYSPPYPDIKKPPYMGYAFGFLYTGAITYHFVSKPFLRKSLRRYYARRKD